MILRIRLLLICLTLLPMLVLVATVAAAERPNVLFIGVDDLRPEIFCYGLEKMVTPNFDRLAERGVQVRSGLLQYCRVWCIAGESDEGAASDADSVHVVSDLGGEGRSGCAVAADGLQAERLPHGQQRQDLSSQPGRFCGLESTGVAPQPVEHLVGVAGEPRVEVGIARSRARL